MRGARSARRGAARWVRTSLALGACVAGAVTLLSLTGALAGARWRLYDLASYLQAGSTPDRRIAIVGITDSDLATYGQWPWPRSLEARLVDRLKADGARVIAFDLLFTEPAANPADDAALAASARAAGNVIFAGYADLASTQSGAPPVAVGIERPAPGLPGAGATGLINALPDGDGVLRRALPWVSVDGSQVPSLDILAAEREAGDLRLPEEIGGGYLVDYGVMPAAFPVVSVGDVLSGRAGPALLAGRIVLVGAWAAGLGDRWLTPLGGPWPGVFVHAESIRTLLDGGLRVPAVLTQVASILVASVAAALLFGVLGPLTGTLALVGLGVAVLVWAAVSVASGVAVNAAAPMLAIVLSWAGSLGWRTLDEQRARVRVTGIFGRHVGPEVVRALLATPARSGQPGVGGARQQVTVLFLDMRGFTALAGSMAPERVVQILDAVFDAVVPIVLGSGGMLDKFVGDGLMAVWNAPVPAADHAARAVAAAVDMQARLAHLAVALWASEGIRVGFGIGVHSGDAVVGTVGTSSRQEYTAIGDTVNVAARLQEHAAAGEILVSDATWKAAAGTWGSSGPGTTLPDACGRRVAVKGRRDPIQAYALRAPAGPGSGMDRQEDLAAQRR
jgi:adenylate cyclase